LHIDVGKVRYGRRSITMPLYMKGAVPMRNIMPTKRSPLLPDPDACAADHSGNAADRIAQVVELLGGESAVDGKITTESEVSQLLTGGLPHVVLKRLLSNLPQLAPCSWLQALTAECAAIEGDEGERTHRFSHEQSRTIWHLAVLVIQATYPFGSRDDAVRWFGMPALALGGACPIDVLLTDSGASQVKDALIRLQYGVYT
jgi:putative toxin-antitoxin system antitoxin component (TIGR02293 family)